MFSVPIYYGIELLPNAYRNNIKIKTLYGKFLYHTIEHSLAHLFKPDSRYGLGYSRSDVLEDLVDVLAGNDLEVGSVFQIVEDKVYKALKRFIQTDSNHGYGMYTVNVLNAPKGNFYKLIYLGDYRILEWEQGRGKPQEEIKDSAGTLEQGSPLKRKPGVSPSNLKVRPKRNDSLLKRFDAIGKDLDDTVRDLRVRLEEGAYIAESDMTLLLEHCQVTIADEITRITEYIWNLNPISSKEQAFLDIHEPYYIINTLAEINTKAAKKLALSKREKDFRAFYNVPVTAL